MVLPVLWLLLAGLALVLAWTTRAGAFAWVGYLMIAIWAIGAVAARLGARGLSTSRDVSADRIPFGGKITAEVTVTNRGWLPVVWLAASEALPAGLPMTGLRGRIGPLGGRAQFSFRYALQGARRGWYEIGPTLLRTGDLFGLVRGERAAAPASHLIVFPRIVAIEHAGLPSRRPAGEVRTRQRVLEDPTRVVGVRPYQYGDGLRRVHWRATAHTGRLQSKLFEISAQVETTVVVNLNRADYADAPGEAEDAAERAVVAAASIAHHIIERRERVALIALGRDPAGEDTGGVIRVRGGRGRNHAAELLSALGRLELGPAQDLASVLTEEKESLAWGSLLVLVTPELPESLLPTVVGLRKSGFEVSVVVTARAGPGRTEEASLTAFGVDAARVLSEADIRGLAI